MKLNPIKSNMHELETNDAKVLFSYKTPVAFLNKDTGRYYKTSAKFSQTTSRHINTWLNGEVADLVDQELIDKIAKHI